jgi:hypothetical protein
MKHSLRGGYKTNPIGWRTFFGWRVVGARFVVAVFAWGVGFYGPPVFLDTLHASRGWPISKISTAVTCHFLLSTRVVAHLPSLHRRWGLVAVTRTGAAASGLGALAWAAAGEPWQLFPAAVVSGLGWATTSGAAINAMVAPWLDRRRPAPISMAFNGASLGGMVFTRLWALLIAQYGFPAAAALVGAAMLLVLWWLAGGYLRPMPETLGLLTDGDLPTGIDGRPAEPPTPPRLPLPIGAAVWRDRRFATLSAAFALGLFAQIELIAHLFSPLASPLGETGAGAALSLATACAVLGRTLLGTPLPTSMDRRIAAAINFAVQITGGAVLLAVGDVRILLLLGCALFGLGLGSLTSLPPLIAQAEFARADEGRIVALVTALNQTAFAFTPATTVDGRGASDRPADVLACRNVGSYGEIAQIVGDEIGPRTVARDPVRAPDPDGRKPCALRTGDIPAQIVADEDDIARRQPKCVERHEEQPPCRLDAAMLGREQDHIEQPLDAAARERLMPRAAAGPEIGDNAETMASREAPQSRRMRRRDRSDLVGSDDRFDFRDLLVRGGAIAGAKHVEDRREGGLGIRIGIEPPIGGDKCPDDIVHRCRRQASPAQGRVGRRIVRPLREAIVPEHEGAVHVEQDSAKPGKP